MKFAIILSSVLILSGCGGGGEPCTINNYKLVTPDPTTQINEYFNCREEVCGDKVYRTCRPGF